ncbi:MAG TPA: hypothetical protein VM077_01175 [Candidatus Limnocylindrales bacterium]|nr:hypothetical protein [Candidatus Limnocylindrales bacterium]
MAEQQVLDRDPTKAKEPTAQPERSKDRPQSPGAKNILDQIRRGRKSGEDPHDILISTAEGDRPKHHKPAREKPWHPRTATKTPEPRQLNTASVELTAREWKSLSFDFDTYLQKNSPIANVLDSKTEIAEGPNEHLLAKQQEAMATCRTLIEAYIEQDPIGDSGTSKAKLAGLVEKFGASYKFTDQQKHITKDLVNKYYEHRQDAVDFRAKYKDDRELVRKLTGLKIPDNAKFDIHVGPWGLEITADNDSVQNILYRGETPPTDFCAGGLADVSNFPPFIILNKNFSDKKTLAHERQHVRYELGKRVLERNGQPRNSNRNPDSNNPTSENDRLERDLRQERKIAFDSLKDEIFAYSFNADKFPVDLFVGKDGNPYDYLKNQREYGANHRDPRYREASQKVFVDEYDAMVSSAAADFATLMDTGYSKQTAIALLVDKTLEEWSTTTDRLLEMNGKSTDTRHRKEEITVGSEGPIISSNSQIVDGRSVRIIDVVITEDDKKPNWYKERSITSADGKPAKDKNTTTETDDTDTSQSVILTTINKTLYEKTRDIASRFITDKGGLEQYFAILDQETLTISKASTDSRPDEQKLEEAKNRVLSQLESHSNKPQETTGDNS